MPNFWIRCHVSLPTSIDHMIHWSDRCGSLKYMKWFLLWITWHGSFQPTWITWFIEVVDIVHWHTWIPTLNNKWFNESHDMHAYGSHDSMKSLMWFSESHEVSPLCLLLHTWHKRQHFLFFSPLPYLIILKQTPLESTHQRGCNDIPCDQFWSKCIFATLFGPCIYVWWKWKY